MSDKQQTVTVEIPERTAVQLSKRLPKTEFDSIDDYVAFALDQLLEELDRQDLDSEDQADVDRTEDEPLEGNIENRLKSLGYL